MAQPASTVSPSRGETALSGGQTPPTQEDVWIPSVCKMCGNGCGIRVHRVNGVVVQVEGNPDNPHSFGRLCAKGQAAIMALYDPARPRTCLRRTNPRKGLGEDPGWRPVSWDEAVDEVVGRLRTIAAEDPRKLMFINGIAEINMARDVAAALAEAFGTPNWALSNFFGTHTRGCYLNTGSMHTEPDLDYCRLLILFGCQKGALSAHDTMKTASALAEARKRGMKLAVFDPMCSPIASKADEWVPLLPGTDGAVALGMLHVLLNELRITDGRFLTQQTNAAYLVGPDGRYARAKRREGEGLPGDTGAPLVWDRAAGAARPYDDPGVADPSLTGTFEVDGVTCRPALELLRQQAAQFPPERVEAISTVPAATLRRLAREFGETAQVGAAIRLEGTDMPFRPVCALADSRGATCHGQGMWTGTSFQLLNVVVGAVDVPGGSISTNVVGPGERPRITEGPDGVVGAGGTIVGADQPYPGRPASVPQTAHLRELFPVGTPRSMIGLAPLEYSHLVPYHVEVLVLFGTNMLASGPDPQRMAEALRRIPLVVAVSDRLDETLEYADLVFPTATHLERLDFPTNRLEGWVTGKHWYYTARQTVVEPPPDVHQTADIFLEWADRLGLLPKVNELLNAKLRLSDEYKLEPERRYTNADIVQRRMQAMFGPDHDLGWFQEHGLVAWERTLAERYPRALVPLPRVPVYFPHMLDRGQELRTVLDQLRLEWDLSQYQPVPVWLGCWSHHQRRPEQLYVVNYKLGFQTSTTTQNNPWLMEQTQHHRLALYVTLNARTGRQRGIADGDEIELTGSNGYTARARARLSECIHPDVVGIASCFGHWAQGQPVAAGKGVHFNSFVPFTLDTMDVLSGYTDHCALVTVWPVKGGNGRARHPA
jgi:molybdopterin-containing oxidoreductase family molybdopterin binding subunit